LSIAKNKVLPLKATGSYISIVGAKASFRQEGLAAFLQKRN